jgi:hypothetical protein
MHELTVSDLDTGQWLECEECDYLAMIVDEQLIRLNRGDPTVGHLASW